MKSPTDTVSTDAGTPSIKVSNYNRFYMQPEVTPDSNVSNSDEAGVNISRSSAASSS